MKFAQGHCFNSICWLILFLMPLSLLAGPVFPSDTIRTHTMNCNAGSNVCVSIPATAAQNYDFKVNGVVFNGIINGCDYDTIISYSYHTLPGLGGLGPYRLDSWVVNGKKYSGEFANLGALVSMMNQWDTKGNWVQQSASLTIKGGAPSGNYSNMSVTALSNNTLSVLGMNFGLVAKGISFSLTTGVHTIIAEDKVTKVKDTLTVILLCGQPPKSSTVRETIPANEFSFTYKVDVSELNGPAKTIKNICGTQSGEFVRFSVDASKMNVSYKGLKCGGQEQACIVVCDEIGVCDTTFLIVTVDFSLCEKKSQFKSDTVVLNFTRMMCLDKTRLPGKIASVENLCSSESGHSVDFDYDATTHCLNFTGIAAGTERACYLIRDEHGNIDTAFVSVHVRRPQTGIIIDTLQVGQQKTYCVDFSELAGKAVNIINLCPTKSGNLVDFSLDPLTLCVQVKGQAPGSESACIVICDNYGVCDTTSMTITVAPKEINPCANSLPPVANNDMASTLLSTLVNIKILGNDVLGTCPNFSITIPAANSKNGPKHGLTVLNTDNSVDYLPSSGYCGLDTFQYVLCGPKACDTATVIVVIDCIPADSIVVNTGFSPNGDGVNDFFTIRNIENFPDNEVRVFNRWGAIVYTEQRYKNQWGGSFRDADLPDGTYFYMIKMKGAKEEMKKGYLQIRR